MNRFVRFVAVALLILACTSGCCALLADFPECENEDGLIDNRRENCEYSMIFCDGDESMFCNGDEDCDEEYACPLDETDNTNSSTTANLGSSTTTTVSSNSTGSSTTPSVSTVTPTNVREVCRRGVTKKYRYPGNCNYFFHCMDGYWGVGECPMGYAFNETSGLCSGRIVDTPECRNV